jgi:hypothetical protein
MITNRAARCVTIDETRQFCSLLYRWIFDYENTRQTQDESDKNKTSLNTEKIRPLPTGLSCLIVFVRSSAQGLMFLTHVADHCADTDRRLSWSSRHTFSSKLLSISSVSRSVSGVCERSKKQGITVQILGKRQNDLKKRTVI